MRVRKREREGEREEGEREESGERGKEKGARRRNMEGVAYQEKNIFSAKRAKSPSI